MRFAVTVSTPVITAISGAQVIRRWHRDSETLAVLEVGNVKGRTPVDTGALAASVDGTNNPGSGPELATVYFNEANQLAEWGRIYAPYQEGPPLGLSTYTNDPRHMVFDAQDADAPAIIAWAVTSGQGTIDMLNQLPSQVVP